MATHALDAIIEIIHHDDEDIRFALGVLLAKGICKEEAVEDQGSGRQSRVSRIHSHHSGGTARTFPHFNLWNWHTFTGSGICRSLPFNTWYGSPDFGLWNKTVSQSGVIQLDARLEF